MRQLMSTHGSRFLETYVVGNLTLIFYAHTSQKQLSGI